MNRTVRQIANRLLRRIALGSGMGVQKLAAKESTKTRQVQLSLLADMIRDGVNNPEPYGFSARPFAGAVHYFLALGGDPNKLTSIIASDPRYRPTDLQEGEVCLYTDEGDRVTLKRGRIIEVLAGAEVRVSAPQVTVTASSKVTLDTPTVECTGDFSADGNISSGADISAAGNVSDANGSMQEMRDTYNVHGAGAPNHPPGDMQ